MGTVPNTGPGLPASSGVTDDGSARFDSITALRGIMAVFVMLVHIT